jgi:hypothetical protein
MPPVLIPILLSLALFLLVLWALGRQEARILYHEIVLPPRTRTWATWVRRARYLVVMPLALAWLSQAQSFETAVSIFAAMFLWGLTLSLVAKFLERWADPHWERRVIEKS